MQKRSNLAYASEREDAYIIRRKTNGDIEKKLYISKETVKKESAFAIRGVDPVENELPKVSTREHKSLTGN